MQYNLEPLRVECNSCGTFAETYNYSAPDLCVVCDCCPVEHDHTGLGCRSVTIWASAHLTLFDINELMEMAAEMDSLSPGVPELDAGDRDRMDVIHPGDLVL